MPKNPAVGTYEDFCVRHRKPQAARDIPRDGASGAIATCQAIGAGYDLMTNAEWQTVAREVETAYTTGGGYLNWSNGSDAGSNTLTPGQAGGGAGSLELSNGGFVFNLSGSVSQWVKDNNSSPQGNDDYVSNSPWSSQSQWGPLNPNGTYSSMTSGAYGGLGFQYLNHAGGAIARGGYSPDSVEYSGVFAATCEMPRRPRHRASAIAARGILRPPTQTHSWFRG